MRGEPDSTPPYPIDSFTELHLDEQFVGTKCQIMAAATVLRYSATGNSFSCTSTSIKASEIRTGSSSLMRAREKMSRATFLMSMHNARCSFENIRTLELSLITSSTKERSQHKGKRENPSPGLLIFTSDALLTILTLRSSSRRGIIWIFNIVKITFIYEVKIIIQNWKLKYLIILVLIYLYVQLIHIYNYYLNYLDTKLYS